MTPNYASEFTPELGEGYLAGQLNDLDERERSEEGRATSEGVAGGLIGKFSQAGKVGAIRQGSDIAKNDVIGKFNLGVANMKRDERLTDEHEAYQSTEAQKQRDFQEMLAQQGYEHENAMQSGELHAAERGQLIGGAFGLAGSGMKAAGMAYGGI